MIQKRGQAGKVFVESPEKSGLEPAGDADSDERSCVSYLIQYVFTLIIQNHAEFRKKAVQVSIPGEKDIIALDGDTKVKRYVPCLFLP